MARGVPVLLQSTAALAGERPLWQGMQQGMQQGTGGKAAIPGLGTAAQ